MSVAHAIRVLLRRVGIEVSRYNPVQSEAARLARLLRFHGIDFVIDVGANDGGYGRFLRSIGYMGQILSFEPLSTAYDRLVRAVSKDPCWRVAPRCCLGDENSEAEINISGNSTSSSLLPMASCHEEAAPESRVTGTEKVSVRRLDDIRDPILAAANAILLKIDTQGYEMQVLRGARQLLSRTIGLQVELSLIELYRGQVRYRELIDWLEQYGFTLWSVIPGFRDPASGRMLQMDGLFFREGGHSQSQVGATTDCSKPQVPIDGAVCYDSLPSAIRAAKA